MNMFFLQGKMIKNLLLGCCILMLLSCTSPIRKMSEKQLINSKAKYINAYSEELKFASDKRAKRLSIV
jgi:hypothetical protein